MSEKYTSENIRALDGGEHVKMRPKMYFEKCFSENTLDALPFEVLCHAFDEYFDGNCNDIKLTVWTNAFSVQYNAGMSLAKSDYNLTVAEIIMTKIGACSNLKKHLAVGQEFCGLGMAIINFASEKCKLTTVSNHKKGEFEFEDGIIKSKHIEPTDDASAQTEIYIKPSASIFENLQFTAQGVKEKATEINKRLDMLNLVLVDNIE